MFRQQIYRTERNKRSEEKVTVENKDTKGCFPWTFLHKNQKVYRAEQDSRVGWRPQNRQPVRQNKSKTHVLDGGLTFLVSFREVQCYIIIIFLKKKIITVFLVFPLCLLCRNFYRTFDLADYE